MPWVLYGDFNFIFAPFDKLMGDFNLEDVRLTQGLVRDLHLVEPLCFGKQFTSTNDQENPIWVKLDHFFINSNWMKLFPKVFQNFLLRLGSNHVPIRL